MEDKEGSDTCGAANVKEDISVKENLVRQKEVEPFVSGDDMKMVSCRSDDRPVDSFSSPTHKEP